MLKSFTLHKNIEQRNNKKYGHKHNSGDYRREEQTELAWF